MLDFDASGAHSNLFEMECPRLPRAWMQSFPEIDRAEWMTPDRARTKLVKGQVPALDALAEALADRGLAPSELLQRLLEGLVR